MFGRTDTISTVKRSSQLCALFLVPFILRYVYLLMILGDKLLYLPDERLYLGVGKRYIQGILSGDISVFLENAEHPPLAKIMVGLFGFALAQANLQDWQVLRFYSSIIGGLTCLVVYFFGERLRRGLGWKAWLLSTVEPSSIFFGMASLDVTYSLFASASMLFLYKNFQGGNRRHLLLSGAIFGLSFSSKYPAVAFAAVPVLWSIYHGYRPKRILPTLGLFVVPALATAFVTNPILWSGSNLTAMLSLQSSMEHTSFLGWFNPTIGAIQRGASPVGVSAHFLMDLYGVVMFPVGDMINSPYLIILTLSLIGFAIRRTPIEDLFFKILLIFFCPFYFFLSIPKQISYYAVVYSPYVSLIVSILVDSLGKRCSNVVTGDISKRRWRLLFLPVIVFFALGSAAPILAVQAIAAMGLGYPHATAPSSWIHQIFGMDFEQMFPTLMIILYGQLLASVALSRRLPMFTCKKKG